MGVAYLRVQLIMQVLTVLFADLLSVGKHAGYLEFFDPPCR